MDLFKDFGNKLEKETISQTWKITIKFIMIPTNNIRDLCNFQINEENEFKILRKMCLNILWNILKYPKHIKYRQIHKYQMRLQKIGVLPDADL
ncbi:hypothetical protein RFI_31619 [Reticulomyxa filosa]|uniref:Uncharacterized protein n=1 Tax=Reticulomyxa filosa TaxID=46433 RepID=X6LXB4_RETFI|nr:hypothetical protein RFI_31619 [Reticulomyxa filosa]|eukprot:ETO05777.1 hypothetical protein RFI_31619 [Reticulomyxa filosa]